MTFSELANRYLSERGGHLTESSRLRYDIAVQMLSRHLALRLPARVDREQTALRTALRQWETVRRAKTKARTFNAELALLDRVFNFAMSEGLLARNPVAGIRPQKIARQVMRVPTREQLTELIDWLKLHHSPIADYIEFLALSGFRKSEAIALTWQDIDFAGKMLRVYRVKSNYEQLLPLSAGLERLLLRLRDGPQPEAHDRIFFAGTARYWLKLAADALQQPRWSEHDFRHAFATAKIAELGANHADIVAELLGHADGGQLCLKTYSGRAQQILKE